MDNLFLLDIILILSADSNTPESKYLRRNNTKKGGSEQTKYKVLIMNNCKITLNIVFISIAPLAIFRTQLPTTKSNLFL